MRCSFCLQPATPEDSCHGCGMVVCELCDDGVPVGLPEHDPMIHQAQRQARARAEAIEQASKLSIGQSEGFRDGLLAIVDAAFPVIK